MQLHQESKRTGAAKRDFAATAQSESDIKHRHAYNAQTDARFMGVGSGPRSTAKVTTTFSVHADSQQATNSKANNSNRPQASGAKNK